MMKEWLESAVKWFEVGSIWELVAVVLALAYLILAVKRNLWCWVCGFISSAIYVALMFEVRLYMQVLLNIFYVAMAVYGYFEWTRRRNTQGEVAIVRWSTMAHIAAAVGVTLVSFANGWWMSTHSDASSPYLDAFVTWGSVVTTWMVARRVIENWLYWIVVDGVAAYVYFQQGLHATGILFLIYIGIVIQGFRVWRRESRAEAAPLPGR